jgi:L-ascorbate metabolism protein UlaG (beta-lactamase superfamily)
MAAELKYYGHSCFELRTAGKSIIFDPFIGPNPLAAGIDMSTLNPDFMLISHGHSDHIADAVQIARQSACLVIGVWEVTEWFKAQGIDNVHPMNIGGARHFDFGRVKLVNAVHSSSFPDGSYAGNPCGFLVMNDELNLYYSGDTALHRDMKLIPEFAALDAACLCIGDNFTMGVDDALLASEFIRCDEIIGMHFDTFGYITIDHAAAQQAFRDKGKRLSLPAVGDTITI